MLRPPRLKSVILICLMLGLIVATSGCITSSRNAISIRPRLPAEIETNFDFKVGEVKVVDDSYLGYEDQSDSSIAMRRRIKLRFDPRFVDDKNGLTLVVRYTEKRLPLRIIPDMVPYGFPLDFPLFGMVWPVVKTRRYDVSSRIEVLDAREKVVDTFSIEYRAYSRKQEALYLGILWMKLFPISGDFPAGSRMANFYRHEGAARLLVDELSSPKRSAKLRAAYQQNLKRNDGL